MHFAMGLAGCDRDGADDTAPANASGLASVIANPASLPALHGRTLRAPLHETGNLAPARAHEVAPCLGTGFRPRHDERIGHRLVLVGLCCRQIAFLVWLFEVVVSLWRGKERLNVLALHPGMDGAALDAGFEVVTFVGDYGQLGKRPPRWGQIPHMCGV